MAFHTCKYFCLLAWLNLQIHLWFAPATATAISFERFRHAESLSTTFSTSVKCMLIRVWKRVSTHQLTPKLISFIKRSDWDISSTLYELLRDKGQGIGVIFERLDKTSVCTESDLCHLEKLCSKFAHARNVRTAMRHSKEDQPSCTGEYVRILL